MQEFFTPSSAALSILIFIFVRPATSIELPRFFMAIIPICSGQQESYCLSMHRHNQENP
jgi:hypothetical protein